MQMSPSACRAYVANFGILWQFFSPLLGFPLSSRGAMAHTGVTLTIHTGDNSRIYAPSARQEGQDATARDFPRRCEALSL